MKDNPGKNFLTIFTRLQPELLHKDVGAIPYNLAMVCNWRSFIAFFAESEEFRSDRVEAEYKASVNLINFGRRSYSLWNALRTIIFLIKRGREFDVVNFYHDSIKNMAYALVYKLFKPNGIVYFKLDMSHLELRVLEANRHKPLSILARRIKHLISRIAVTLYTVETTSCYQTLADDTYFKGRLYYLPNGFVGPQDADIESIIANKENIILAVGNLGAYAKNFELLVDAVSLLDKELVKGWKVYLVGSLVNADFYEAGYRKSDAFRQYVENVVRKNSHLKDTFVFTGKIDDKSRLFDIYRKAKIFCLTSRYESFGFVLLEAMYFGNYVISSDLPSARDITNDGMVGSLFPAGDVQRLAERITDAIKGDAELVENGRRAHGFVRDNFNWKDISVKLDLLLSHYMNIHIRRHHVSQQ